MTSIAHQRLAMERKNFNVNRPFGMWAKPVKNPDGSTNLLHWEAGFPATNSTSPYHLQDEETYRVEIVFNQEKYPTEAPRCFFKPVIFHTNIFPTDGGVCMSLLLPAGHHDGTVASHWAPSISLSQILLGLQALLDEPNPNSVANPVACSLCRTSRSAYDQRVREETAKYADILAAFTGKSKPKTSGSSSSGSKSGGGVGGDGGGGGGGSGGGVVIIDGAGGGVVTPRAAVVATIPTAAAAATPTATTATAATTATTAATKITTISLDDDDDDKGVRGGGQAAKTTTITTKTTTTVIELE